MNNSKAVRKYYGAINHSKAVIESVKLAPYYGAAPEQGYRLWVADDNGFVYHVSCYQTVADAEHYLLHNLGDGYKRIS